MVSKVTELLRRDFWWPVIEGRHNKQFRHKVVQAVVGALYPRDLAWRAATAWTTARDAVSERDRDNYTSLSQPQPHLLKRWLESLISVLDVSGNPYSLPVSGATTYELTTLDTTDAWFVATDVVLTACPVPLPAGARVAPSPVNPGGPASAAAAPATGGWSGARLCAGGRHGRGRRGWRWRWGLR